MSKFFSVESSWRFTGYFVLMATEVFSCSCVASLWLARHCCRDVCVATSVETWSAGIPIAVYTNFTWAQQGNYSIDGEWKSRVKSRPSPWPDNTGWENRPEGLVCRRTHRPRLTSHTVSVPDVRCVVCDIPEITVRVCCFPTCNVVICRIWLERGWRQM